MGPRSLERRVHETQPSSLPNFPVWKSIIAWRISPSVFITKGPW